MTQLVLFHGRSQQHKPADKLKQNWLESLDKGLKKSGLTLPISEADVRFPYYGDTLFDLVDGKSAKEAAEIVVMGDDVDAEERIFMQQVMEELRLGAGITDAELRAVADDEVVEMGPLNWGWVRAVAQAMDRRGLSGTTVALVTHDVYCYLVDESIKGEIDDGVAAAFKPGVKTVVVGHSLGSVISHSLLCQRGKDEGWSVPQLVTVGSPLAVSRIVQSILPPRWPGCVDSWYNAMDANDIVALHPLTPRYFNVGDAHEITNKTDVDNHTDNQHGISGYLDDKDVARVIYDALTAA
jgi:hypothetical protein